MNDAATHFLFRVWPYTAVALAGVGFVVRGVVMTDRMPAVRRAMPEVRRLFFGGRLARAAFVLLAVGHVVGLVAPRAIAAWNVSAARMIVLEAVAFAGGVVVLGAWLRAIMRHLRRASDAPLLDVADAVLLAFVLVGAASGVLAAAVDRWWSAWAIVTLTPYVASLVHGAPAMALVARLPFLVRLHVATAFGALAILPLTRIAPLLLLPVIRGMELARRPFATAAGRTAAIARKAATTYIWPDVEYRWVIPVRDANAAGATTVAGVWRRAAADNGVPALERATTKTAS